ncbi:MAG: hypothetical protein HLUCCA12_08150 [Rhodobacteraceae bacterium HLUCCA12]|nr:MAG: hypothetical protein HLUCCA12_08150 [Rhodobacteraceae bacterium HLUCCA12]
MKGLSILIHAIGMVTGNLGAALRISAVLMAIQFVLAIVLGVQFLYTGEDTTELMMSGQYPYASTGLMFVIQAVSTLWIAVAWHRFILREEVPGGALPAFNGAAILSYVWAGIIFVLILVVVAIPFGILGGLIAGPLMSTGSTAGLTIGGTLLFLVLWLPVTYVSYRISPILPAAAVQEPIPLKEAWYATGTSGAAFVVLAIVSVLAVWVINLPAFLLAGLSSLLAFVWSFAVQWAVLLVGVSVLTTIYGHFVEKRALNA